MRKLIIFDDFLQRSFERSSASKIVSVKKLLASGIPPRDVAKTLSIFIPTLYRWIPALSLS